MLDNDGFRDGLKQFNEIAEKKATATLRRISLKALQLIVSGTPVDTGCCRGNWVVSVGSLSRAYDPQKTDKNGTITVSSGLTRITSATLGTDVLIENSCPYVMPLENGWSRQKPAGSMIRIPLERLRAAIRNGAK